MKSIRAIVRKVFREKYHIIIGVEPKYKHCANKRIIRVINDDKKNSCSTNVLRCISGVGKIIG